MSPPPAQADPHSLHPLASPRLPNHPPLAVKIPEGGGHYNGSPDSSGRYITINDDEEAGETARKNRDGQSPAALGKNGESSLDSLSAKRRSLTKRNSFRGIGKLVRSLSSKFDVLKRRKNKKKKIFDVLGVLPTRTHLQLGIQLCDKREGWC
jgi:hypothetical protein